MSWLKSAKVSVRQFLGYSPDASSRLIAMAGLGLFLASCFGLVLNRLLPETVIESNEPVVAEVEVFGTDVKRKSSQNFFFVPVKNHEKLKAKDGLYVGPGSKVKIQLDGYGEIEIEPNAVAFLTIDLPRDSSDKQEIKINLSSGDLKFKKAKGAVALAPLKVNLGSGLQVNLSEQSSFYLKKSTEGVVSVEEASRPEVIAEEVKAYLKPEVVAQAEAVESEKVVEKVAPPTLPIVVQLPAPEISRKLAQENQLPAPEILQKEEEDDFFYRRFHLGLSLLSSKLAIQNKANRGKADLLSNRYMRAYAGYETALSRRNQLRFDLNFDTVTWIKPQGASMDGEKSTHYGFRFGWQHYFSETFASLVKLGAEQTPVGDELRTRAVKVDSVFVPVGDFGLIYKSRPIVRQIRLGVSGSGQLLGPGVSTDYSTRLGYGYGGCFSLSDQITNSLGLDLGACYTDRKISHSSASTTNSTTAVMIEMSYRQTAPEKAKP